MVIGPSGGIIWVPGISDQARYPVPPREGVPFPGACPGGVELEDAERVERWSGDRGPGRGQQGDREAAGSRKRKQERNPVPSLGCDHRGLEYNLRIFFPRTGNNLPLLRIPFPARE